MQPTPLIERLRQARGFDVVEVAAAKVGRIERWLVEVGVDSVVVGVSGGVDSALVLALLARVLELPSSPLRRVVALLLPFEGSVGATNQAEATTRGRRVAEAIRDAAPSGLERASPEVARRGIEVWEVPLAEPLRGVVAALERPSSLSFDAWSEGQVLSVVRTPALYGAAALLRAHGSRAVVFGTTNRDEGAYLGFFGKASDGMVDVQPIGDLHKSEVRALARHLGVPPIILDATPRGDVHDGRSDEEMIGASYDEVETYLRLLELEREPATMMAPAAARAIARLHDVNRHKYEGGVGSPARFLDVLPRGVPGGAPDTPFAGRHERRPPREAVPGAWDPPAIELEPLPSRLAEWSRVDGVLGLAIRVERALSPIDTERLAHAMTATASAIAEPVGVTGVRGSGYGIGSVRATAWSEELAWSLFARIRHAVPSVRFLDDASFTDAFATRERRGHRSWRLVGLSPHLRFMRYRAGGRHLCHYDAAYDYGDGRRTLLSVVFYLTTCPPELGGGTRFVRDGQEHLPASARSYDDWSRDTREEEVIATIAPREGDVLVFDHRLCHDVAQWNGPSDRIIIRADVVYEAIEDGRDAPARTP